MKDKKLAETICNVWNEHHTGLFEKTDTNAEVIEVNGDYKVKISPALHNEGNSFHYVKELAAITEAFNKISFLHINGMDEIIAFIM
jgi:hypothetical protein